MVLVANTTAMMVNNVFILYPYSAGNDWFGPKGLPVVGQLAPTVPNAGAGDPKLGAACAPKLGAGDPNAGLLP
jgi:hypothetical protein